MRSPIPLLFGVLFLSSCREVTVSGNSISESWAFGPSMSAIAAVPTLLFLARFIIGGSWQDLWSQQPGVLLAWRTLSVIRITFVLAIVCIFGPLLAIGSALAGIGDATVITPSTVAFKSNRFRYEWRHLRSINKSTKNDSFNLLFIDGSRSAKLDVDLAVYGADAMKLLRSWAEKAALENGIRNGYRH